MKSKMKKMLTSAFVGAIASCAAALEIKEDSWSAKYDLEMTQEKVCNISKVGKMPEGSISFKFGKDSVDLQKVFNLKKVNHRQDRAVVSCVVVSPSDQIGSVGLGADWWFTCYVNGEKIGTTEPEGNYFQPYTSDNYIFPVKFRKGENYVSFYLRPGFTWIFAFCLMPSPEFWPEKYNDKVRIFNKLFPHPEPFALQ